MKIQRLGAKFLIILISIYNVHIEYGSFGFGASSYNIIGSI